MFKAAPLFFVVALSLIACSPREHCATLAVGQSAASLPRGSRITSPQSFHDTLMRPARAVNGDFDRGPVTDQVCCFGQSRGDTREFCPAQLECSAAAFQGVELYSLDEPFAGDLGEDSGQFCYVAVKDGLLVAIWTRWWS